LITVDVNSRTVTRVQNRVGRSKGAPTFLLFAGFLTPRKFVELIARNASVFFICRTPDSGPKSHASYSIYRAWTAEGMMSLELALTVWSLLSQPGIRRQHTPLNQLFNAATLLVQSVVYASRFRRGKFIPRSLRCLHGSGLRYRAERLEKIVRPLRKCWWHTSQQAKQREWSAPCWHSPTPDRAALQSLQTLQPISTQHQKPHQLNILSQALVWCGERRTDGGSSWNFRPPCAGQCGLFKTLPKGDPNSEWHFLMNMRQISFGPPLKTTGCVMSDSKFLAP